MPTIKKVLRKTLRGIALTFTFLIVLLIVLILIVQLPPVQQWLVQKTTSFLSEKTGSNTTVEQLVIQFPKTIVVEGLYVEDIPGDTLLYAGKISVNAALWGLLRKKIRINHIALENCVISVNRSERDSAFNFSHIVDAFSAKTPDTTRKEAVAQDWDLTIRKISLDNIRTRYYDSLEGNFIRTAWKEITVWLDAFDLEEQIILADKIDLDGIRADILQTHPPAKSQEPSEVMDFSVKEITAARIHLQYEQRTVGEIFSLDVGELSLEAYQIDLPQRKISLENLGISGSSVMYRRAGGDTAKNEDKDLPAAETETADWDISVDNLELENNIIVYDDMQKPRNLQAIDPSHLYLSQVNAHLTGIGIRGMTIKAGLQDFSFHEQSGFSVKKLQAGIRITESTATLDSLLLITSNSRVGMRMHSRFRSLSELGKDFTQASVQAVLHPSSIGLRDFLYFSPHLLDSLPVKLSDATQVKMEAAFFGPVNAVRINHLNIASLSGTHIKTSGFVKGLPDIANLHLDIAINDLHTNQKDLEQILSDTLLGETIRLPSWINLRGRYKGNLKKADVSMALTSSEGDIGLHGNMNLASRTNKRGYQAELLVKELNLGYILKQEETIGTITLAAEISGNAMTGKSQAATMVANVGSFIFQRYTYRDVALRAELRNQVLSINASLKDPNADFAFTGVANYSGPIPAYHLSLKVNNADLEALGIREETLRMRGNLRADIATKDLRTFNGRAAIRNAALFDGKDLYTIDSLILTSEDKEKYSRITIASDIVKGKFEGSFNMIDAPGVLQQFFNHYYSSEKKDQPTTSQAQHFTFDLSLKPSPLFTGLVPELHLNSPVNVSGTFYSRTRNFNLRAGIDSIRYADVGIGSFRLRTTSDSTALYFTMTADSITVGDQRVKGLEWMGSIANNTIRTQFTIPDSTGTEKYRMGGVIRNLGENAFSIHFLPQITLNYADWNIPKDNAIRFSGKDIVTHNVILSNGPERIIIESAEGTPLRASFRELNLEYIFSIVAEDKPVSGRLDGEIVIHRTSGRPSFTTDLSIRNLGILGQPWGTATLAITSERANQFGIGFHLASDRNNVSAKGNFTTGKETALDIQTTLSTFDLATLQPLLRDLFGKLAGGLQGGLHVGGTLSQPRLNGKLTFREADILPVFLNSSFRLKQETLSFNDTRIGFDDFRITDKRGNQAMVNGHVATRDYRQFALQLDLTANNFTILNTAEGDNDLFYGNVNVSTRTRIRGTLTHPIVETELSMSDDSHLTYIVPQTEATAMEQSNVVRFVDKDKPQDPFLEDIEPSDTLKTGFTGIDLTATVKLDGNETFVIVIDPAADDRLTVSGNGILNVHIDPEGDMTITGQYAITKGSYNLTFYRLARRTFIIDPGSTMTWLGDPYNARLNIRAIYEVDAAPIDLFASQLATDRALADQYRELLPFLVYLDIAGELMNPEINFRLDMPEDERNAFGGNVYARIQDINTRESELNKQVFALLVLKRFIADDPFSDVEGGLESTARRSVSRILTDQLNRLSENIRGVELTFDVRSYEDFTAGEQGRTELELGLSKSLFNERLVVKLSGNIGIEGRSNEQASDYIGDLAVEYKLTEDGRFRIMGFRNSNYDMIDGELTETGAGLIYIKDYNTLSELFKANERKKK